MARRPITCIALVQVTRYFEDPAGKSVKSVNVTSPCRTLYYRATQRYKIFCIIPRLTSQWMYTYGSCLILYWSHVRSRDQLLIRKPFINLHNAVTRWDVHVKHGSTKGKFVLVKFFLAFQFVCVSVVLYTGKWSASLIILNISSIISNNNNNNSVIIVKIKIIIILILIIISALW
jgi:hypothetical protein